MNLPIAQGRFQRLTHVLMAACLAVMAVAVFVNVVLRYGFCSMPTSEVKAMCSPAG